MNAHPWDGNLIMDFNLDCKEEVMGIEDKVAIETFVDYLTLYVRSLIVYTGRYDANAEEHAIEARDELVGFLKNEFRLRED